MRAWGPAVEARASHQQETTPQQNAQQIAPHSGNFNGIPATASGAPQASCMQESQHHVSAGAGGQRRRVPSTTQVYSGERRGTPRLLNDIHFFFRATPQHSRVQHLFSMPNGPNRFFRHFLFFSSHWSSNSTVSKN